MTMELKLVNLAQRVAEMYVDRLTKAEYEVLCNAIRVCREYHLGNESDWVDMYDVILYDNGIWEYAENRKLEEELQDMWMLETDILMCNCYLGCMAEGNVLPQDMEIQGDNIPEFIEVLQTHIADKIDFDAIFDFWEERMCY